MERGLDALTTNLVVADKSRTSKTICLAVSPALKAFGIPGRFRLFEVEQKIRHVNAERARRAPQHRFSGKSVFSSELEAYPTLAADYIVAVPQMGRYLEVSTQIYSLYLKYVAPEHIHVYSIDEVFLDATPYLRLYRMTAHNFTRILIRDVLKSTGITAMARIGSNLYLSKLPWISLRSTFRQIVTEFVWPN